MAVVKSCSSCFIVMKSVRTAASLAKQSNPFPQRGSRNNQSRPRSHHSFLSFGGVEFSLSFSGLENPLYTLWNLWSGINLLKPHYARRLIYQRIWQGRGYSTCWLFPQTSMKLMKNLGKMYTRQTNADWAVVTELTMDYQLKSVAQQVCVHVAFFY